MSAANLILKNPVNEDIKAVPLGFSWAVLLLGFLVPLHRRDWRGTAVMLAAIFLSYGLALLPLAAFYNRYYARSLFRRGYKLYNLLGTVSKREVDRLIGFPVITFHQPEIRVDAFNLLRRVEENLESPY